MKRMSFYSIVLVLFFTSLYSTGQAQADIKVYGKKINHLDKKKRKQGEWIFFNDAGKAQVSCVFKDDSCISPIVFYNNSDTAFVRIKTPASNETFILYRGLQRFYGSFVPCSDSVPCIQMDDDPQIDESVMQLIKKYRDTIIRPVYYFGQQQLRDYISANFRSADLWFTKNLSITLTISSSGQVTDVDIPGDKNYISGTQEREIYLIFSNMPRWQPLFSKNNTKASKFVIRRNSVSTVEKL